MTCARLVASMLVCICCATVVGAVELELQPYSYHEGFEGEAPQLHLWAKNGESVENFNGVTDEMAFEGEKSLKLDVTLKSGSYHYWGVNVWVPCEGRVKLSARVFVAEGTTAASVGFGTNMVYPPTHHSGCGPTRSFSQPTGDWDLVEVDLVERGRDGAAAVIAKETTNLSGENVGAVLNIWSLFIYGSEGQRAIVYVDDVRIEGEVPSADDYTAEVNQRAAAAKARFAAQVDEWRAQLAEARQALGDLGEPPEAAREVAEAIMATPKQAEELIEKLALTGYASQYELDSLRTAFLTMRHGPDTVDAIAESIKAGKPYLIYTPERTISNQRFASDKLPMSAPIGKELVCAGCRGEYESISAAIYALEDIEGMLVTASDLQGDGGTIPANAVDIYVLKWWYQGGGGIGYSPNKTHLPELLLKDDRLVRVDREAKENYLRSTAEDGTETYLLCSGPTSENLADVRPIDADELQPIDIAADTLQEFWITVHIPEEAQAGTYEGTVSFETQDGSRSLPLRVVVHPFDLLPSRLIYSIYYRAKLSEDGKPTITSEYKSEEQYRAEIEDLKAHGVLYPSNYQGWHDQLLPRVLEIRQEVGMPGGPFYNLGRGTGSTTDEAQLASLQEKVKKWIELCKGFGYDEVYFYGIDEATGKLLAGQRASWKAVQEAGGKTFVACYKKTFEAMGSLLNCAVLAHVPDPAEAEKWHSVGSHAFCYANPQVGVEQPETYRRNFGLVLWKAGFDGAMDYAYQHGFGHVWNDYDCPGKHYRDHNFTYPTVNGVVDTIQWEGFREGVDDVRYVTTLERAIWEAPAAKTQIATQAQEWLDELNPRSGDLYEIRQQMVEWIVKLVED